MNREDLLSWHKKAMNFSQDIVMVECLDTDTEVAVQEKDGYLLLSFMGSGSKLDWKQNFSFWKVPYKDMKKRFFVHAGFMKKFKSVLDALVPYIEKHSDVQVAGFSQGGALAILMHEDIWFHYPEKKLHTVTFGAPRVFASWGYRALLPRFQNILHVINKNDIVPAVPFCWMFYRRVGRVQKLGRRWLPLSVKDHLTYASSIEAMKE